jgi:NitT/TauT family transport system substrate-binding protein
MRGGWVAVGLWVLCRMMAGCEKERTAGSTARRDTPHGLRVGYFPNITHAQALVGHDSGAFEQAVPGIEMKLFNAGPAAMEALSAGSIDASYVGTGPAINTFLKGGRELRLIAVAVDSGAVLVTKTARTPAELKGKTLASPQLGNTQDIAVRHWLGQQGLKVNRDVTVTPLSNPDILGLFIHDKLEGAWVPEPWGARMVAEGGGHILLDERQVWPQRRFHTTVLVTTRKALREQREPLKQLLRVHLELTRQWRRQPGSFIPRVNTAFGKATGKPLSEAILKDAFSRLEPATDVMPEQLQEAAEHARQLGFISNADLSGMIDTSLIQEVMSENPGN